jgi:hypothetical protein
MVDTCETCGILLDRLKDCAKRLDEAISRMRGLAGTEGSEQFSAASRDVGTLRMECQVIRAEVEHHNAEHGLKP